MHDTPLKARCGAAALAGLLLLLAGCSGGDSPPDAGGGPSGEGQDPAQTEGQTQEGNWESFQGRPMPLPGWGVDMMKRRDPQHDGWQTEVAAGHIEAALDQMLQEFRTGDVAGGVRKIGTSSLRVGNLRPEVAEVFDDGSLRVLRTAEGAAPEPPSEDVDAATAKLAEALRDADVQVDRWVRTIELDGSSATTNITLRLLSQSSSARVQIQGDWSARWKLASGKATLEELVVNSQEEVHTRKATFTELTEQVLGHNDLYAAQILTGNESYHLRWDRNAGQAFVGMHGLALGDVNGDGLEDLYLLQPGTQPNWLLVQNADGTFTDRAADGEVDYLDNGRTALFLDLDNDGDQELAVASGPHIIVSWNDGKGGLEDPTPLRGPGDTEIYCLTAADADGDGDLDIYAGRYDKDGVTGGVPTPYHDAHNGASNFFWRNDGDRKFTDATAEVGLDNNNQRFTLAAIWEDFDDDGDADLYVVNDFGRNNFFLNEGGKFRDIAEEVGAIDMAAGMGATIADVDHDGDMDMYVSNMFSAAGERVTSQKRYGAAGGGSAREHYMRHSRGNTLLINDGSGRFEDATDLTGTGPGGWAWGGMFLDINNDTLDDLYVPNGFLSGTTDEDLDSFFWRCVVGSSPESSVATEDYKNAWATIRHMTVTLGWTWNGYEPNYAYLNLGDLNFADVSAAIGGDYKDDGRVAALMDWNDDGRIDLLLRNRNGPRLRLLRNDHEQPGHFLRVRLEGVDCNRDAIGARVKVQLASGKVLQKSVFCGEGHLGQSSKWLHFGLGDQEQIDKLTVRWPGGKEEVHEGLQADTRLFVREGDAPQLLEPREPLALSGHAGSVLPSRPQAVTRVVPAARMPMAQVPLPQYRGVPVEVQKIGSGPRLVVLWSNESEGALALLKSLSERADALGQIGLTVVPIDLSNPKASGEARKQIEDLGFGEFGGRMTQNLQRILEVLMLEILGPFPELPLPSALLIDPSGQLVCLHAGDIDVMQLLRDASRARFMEADSGSTARMSGGRWILGYGRDLARVASVLRGMGMVDLARYYEQIGR